MSKALFLAFILAAFPVKETSRAAVFSSDHGSNIQHDVTMQNTSSQIIELTEKDKARFWSKVDKNGPIVKPDLGPCWVWRGSILATSGYGRMKIKDRAMRAHRLSILIHSGALSEKLICHLCDNRLCVNPSHLIEQTHKWNMNDMVEKRRQAFGSRHADTVLDSDDVCEIRRQYSTRNRTITEIASTYECCISTIHRVVRGVSWKHIPIVEKMPTGRIDAITNAEVQKIIEMRQQGFSMPKIAKSLNIGTSSVFRKLKGC